MKYIYVYYDCNNNRVEQEVDKYKAIELLKDYYIKADELAEMAGGIYPLLFCRSIEIIEEGENAVVAHSPYPGTSTSAVKRQMDFSLQSRLHKRDFYGNVLYIIHHFKKNKKV